MNDVLKFNFEDDVLKDGVTAKDIFNNASEDIEEIVKLTSEVQKYMEEKDALETNIRICRALLKDKMIDNKIKEIKGCSKQIKITNEERFICLKEEEFIAELSKSGFSQFIKVKLEPDFKAIKEALYLDTQLESIFKSYVRRMNFKNLEIEDPISRAELDFKEMITK